MEVAVYGFSGVKVLYQEDYRRNEEIDEPGVARMQRDGDGSGHIALSFESGKGLIFPNSEGVRLLILRDMRVIS